MAESGDLAQVLRALVEYGPALRVAGFAAVTLPGGLTFTLRAAAPAPPVGAVARASDDDDADEELTSEAEELRDAEARWKDYWTRMLRSSGAPVPPFPGLEAARRAAPLIGGRA